MQEAIIHYWQQHGWVGVVAGWALFSTVINMLFRLQSADSWVRMAEKNPKAAAAVKAIRGAGVDPVAAIVAFQKYFDEKANNVKKAEAEAKAEELKATQVLLTPPVEKKEDPK